MLKRSIFSLSLVVATASAMAQTVPLPSDPGLLGTTQASTWLTLGSASGYSLSGPIASQQGNATFALTGGSPMFLTDSIYGFMTGGTFELNVANALSGVEDVVFQTRISKASGGDITLPSLSYLTSTGATGSLNATQSVLATGSLTATGTNANASLYAFSWDLSGLGSIASYTIGFRTIPHTAFTDIRLDQAAPAPVPEPASMAALAFGAATLLRRRRRA